MGIKRIELPAESRRRRTEAPRYAIIHGTQGATSIERQDEATVSWMTQRGGRPASDGWGPACDILIDHEGNETFSTLDGQDFHATRSNWSAGRGAAGTFPADEFGVAIELAQTSKGERPTDATLRAAINRCAYLAITYGWPIERIGLLTQDPKGAVQRGFVGHEDTANGRFTGKWDPNKKTFPWDWFISEIRTEVERRTAPAVTLTAHQQQVVDWLRSDEGQLLSRSTQQAVLIQAGVPADYLARGGSDPAPSPETPKPEPAPVQPSPPAGVDDVALRRHLDAATREIAAARRLLEV